MVILASAICSLGVLQIFSATHDTAWAGAWWKQVVWILAGFIAMWFATLIDYHTLLGQIPILYSLSVATLIGTFAFGMTAFHSRRWIGTTSLHLQVSEFVKLVIVLLVARYMTELKTEQLELPDLLKLGGLVGLPMALVMLQPDLGSHLSSDSGCGRFRRRAEMAICGRHSGDRRVGDAGRIFFCVEGLSKSQAGEFSGCESGP